ncbi:LysR family transcriptional regulator [Flexibacterium corallicola]|uniref:LysR family transcriptional regulator n=1 Tax=Flexibacterium corallicola TaxID=3037259 RepID=UPI00286EC6FD|nr:LysR family transcriptional regulator [Pseudovibrio sp. M1P-2-3]
MSTENLTEYLRIFRTVVDKQSFSAAARDLNMTPAWVARQVTRLETHLNASLLIRSTRQLHLTAAGQECYNSAGRVMEELGSLRDVVALDSRQLRGKITINIPRILASDKPAELICGIQECFPDLSLDFTVSDHFVDPLSGDYDIILRIAHRLPDSNALQRKIGEVPRVLCASPKYLQLMPVPQKLSDIQQHRALMFKGLQSTGQWKLKTEEETGWVAPKMVIEANSSPLLKAATIAGRGLAFLPQMIIDKELASGELVEIAGFAACDPMHLYILRPPTTYLPTRTKVVWDYLTENLAGILKRPR